MPAAIARLFARSVPELEAGAALIALALGLVGLRVAYEFDLPPGATIATLGGVTFAACLGLRGLIGLRRPEVAR